MIGVACAWVCAAGFLVIGSATFPFPGPLARAYGAPVDDRAGLTLLRALGLRDVALGLALAGHLILGDVDAAAVVMAVTALIALLDFALVLQLNGRLVPPLTVHAGGFVLSAGGALLLVLHR